MTNAMTIFREELKANSTALVDVLPSHLTADRLNRTVISAIKKDPALLQCDRGSLFRAVMTAAVFGLEVDGRQAAIVRFKNQAQLLPMYSGLITLAWNAGFVIDTSVVRKLDRFEWTRGLNPSLKHIPTPGQGRGNDNPVVAAYAVAWPKGHRQDHVFEVLELPDIIRRRDRSAAWKAKGDKSPWGTDFAAMARKSAIRALANQLPWQVQKADELEVRADQGEATWATKAEDSGIVIDGEAVEVPGDDDVA